MLRFMLLRFKSPNPMELRRSRRGRKHGAVGIDSLCSNAVYVPNLEYEANVTLGINLPYPQEPGLISIPRSIR